MGQLSGKSILILATNGFEQSELDVPHGELQAAGATVHIASPEPVELRRSDGEDGSVTVCASPCDQGVPALDGYWIVGEGMRRSDTFSLEGQAEMIVLEVSPPSVPGQLVGYTFGIAGTGALVLAGAAGLGFLLVSRWTTMSTRKRGSCCSASGWRA